MAPPPIATSDDASKLVSALAAEDTKAWYQRPNLRLLYILFFPTCLGVEMTSGFDSSMMNGLQAVDSWDLFFNKPRGSKLGLLSAIYSLGAIVSLPLVPVLADGLGRRHAIAVGSLIMILGGALQAASTNFGMFIASRFILGLGIPVAIVAASSLLGELGHPNQRTILGSLFNACWFIGAIVAAGTTLGTFKMKSNWGWRIPSLLQAIPSLMQIVFIYALPESPRWLVSKGRGDEALAILIKYHGEGDETAELPKAEYVQIQKTLELESETKKVGWMALLNTPGMRKRALIGAFLGLATQWSGNNLISYYLARILDNVGITDNRTKNLINLANTCWGFANATVLALTIPRFKRRNMYLLCTSSLLVVYVAWTIASAQYDMHKSKSASYGVIALIFLYSPAYNIGYNALTYTFLVELFPFHVRAKGISLFQWFSRMAGFFNTFVNPIGLKAIGWKYYIMYCVFLAVEVIFMYVFIPETLGRSLEELAFLFEEDELIEQKRRIERELEGTEGTGSEKSAKV